MSALSIQPTYPIFTDIDGQPLEDGYVWIGVANLAPIVNPITVYWDAALTIPAVQPIRTRGGYPVNSGTPARLYVNSDYSIQVQNKNGSVVYSAPAATERYGNIITAATIDFSHATTYPQGTVGNALQLVVNVKNAPFNAVGDGVADDTVAIQTAINYAATENVGVFFPAGTYLLAGTLTAGSNAALVGEGPGRSVLLKKTASTGHILDILGTSTKSNIYIAGFSFDCNLIDAGIVLEHVSDLLIENCYVFDTPYWGINLGKTDSTSSSIVNDNVTVRNCKFENTTQTYEHLLIFNSKNVVVDDCHFKTAADGIGIGIYQNADNVVISNSYFEDMKTGLYYSLSTNNITISNSFFRNNINGIQGANLSDNGAFGYSRTYNVNVLGCTFQGNTGTPVQFGAVKGATLSTCYIDQNSQYGALINQGGISVTSVSSDITVQDTIFRNNNTSNISSSNAPGILVAGFDFSAVDLIVNACQFYDDRGTQYQNWPIVFSGAYAAGQFIAIGSRLSAYNGAESVGFINGGSAGTAFQIINCLGVSSSLPANVKLADSRAMWEATGTGQQTFRSTGDVVAYLTAGAGYGAYLRMGRVGSTDNGLFYSVNDNLTVLTNGTSQVTFDSGGSLKPYTDNVSFLGTGSNRWKEIFAANGTINTSDANEKQQIRSLNEAEKRVALKLKQLVKAYKFNDAVAEKGENARLHVGWIAQEVVAAFTDEGLDAMKYGVVCFDEWDDEFEQEFDENGKLIANRQIIKAGSRFGLRYTELIAFVIASV